MKKMIFATTIAAVLMGSTFANAQGPAKSGKTEQNAATAVHKKSAKSKTHVEKMDKKAANNAPSGKAEKKAKSK